MIGKLLSAPSSARHTFEGGRVMERLRQGAIAATVAGVAVAAAATSARGVEIEEVRSEGGVVAWLVEERAIPIVSIVIGFDGGASLDPAEQAGRAQLFGWLLDEGAGTLDAAAFARAEEETALRLSITTTRDQTRVTITMLADRLDESLELARLALTEPRFDEEAVERMRAQLISQIRENSVEPQRIAAQRWLADVFPGDSYGRPVFGFEETVSAITIDDLRAAQNAYLNRATVTVGVVGAISADDVGPVLDRLLGGLDETPPPPSQLVEPQAVSGVEVIEFDAPQSTVIFGHHGIARSDPDYITAFIVNHVVGGGGFESRLMTEIRERRGLAYGAYSYLSPFDRSAVYLGNVATRNDAVAQSIEIVRQEWRRVAEEGLSEADLERAKMYLTGAYPLRFDSNARIARFLVAAQQENLGIDYINIRNDLVRAVTVEDTRRVAARIFDADALYFVVVGRPEGL